MAGRADQHREWKCLSVRQPFAWAIIKGAKDVENRGQMRKYVGRLYIHAGRTEMTDRIDNCVKWLRGARGQDNRRFNSSTNVRVSPK